ncbi:MAG: hypothetical protein RL885_20455 [Planctomycetota bacterium]
MNFEDKVLVQLASEASRTALLSQRALINILLATYGLDEAALQGVAVPKFSSFSFGGLEPQGTSETQESPPEPERIDALWQGSVRVEASWPRARIDRVAARSVSLSGLDDAVAQGNGGQLPSGAALEAARRAELRKRVQMQTRYPDGIGERLVDGWLREAGVGAVGELLATAGATHRLSSLQLEVSPPIGGTDLAEIELPVGVALLIRDSARPEVSLTQILAATRRIRASLRRAGFEPKTQPEVTGPGKAIVALFVSDAWFGDSDWPGADSAARIQAASQWLAREGIALAPVSP